MLCYNMCFLETILLLLQVSYFDWMFFSNLSIHGNKEINILYLNCLFRCWRLYACNLKNSRNALIGMYLMFSMQYNRLF